MQFSLLHYLDRRLRCRLHLPLFSSPILLFSLLHMSFCSIFCNTAAAKNVSSFYDAFVSLARGLFNTRDRAEHTRKRKIVAHTFSAKSIGQFEQYMHHNLELFVKRWDGLSVAAGPQSYAKFDALNWFNYLGMKLLCIYIKKSLSLTLDFQRSMSSAIWPLVPLSVCWTRELILRRSRLVLMLSQHMRLPLRS